MKTNEIITEGPMWQGIKGAAQSIGNVVGGAKAGYQQGQGQEIVNKSAAVSTKQWNQLAGQLNQAGTPPTVDQLVAFVKKQAPTAKIQPPVDINNVQAVNDYITKSVAQHISNQAMGQQGQAQQAADQQQSADLPTSQQQRDDHIATGGKFDDQTGQPIPAQGQQQAPAQEPAVSTKPSANQFAQKLKADIDQFVNAGGGLGAPAVKSLLKDLWMQAGGVKAESKKTKKKPV